MDPNKETRLEKEGKALHQLTVSWLNINVIRNICLYPVIKTTLSHELLSASKQHRYSPLIRRRVPWKKRKKAEIWLAQRRAELLGCKRGWWVFKRDTKRSSSLPRADLSHSFCVYHGFGGRRYVCTDRCFLKKTKKTLTLSGGTNEPNPVFVVVLLRSHASVLTIIDKNNHFFCSIDI